MFVLWRTDGGRFTPWTPRRGDAGAPSRASALSEGFPSPRFWRTEAELDLMAWSHDPGHMTALQLKPRWRPCAIASLPVWTRAPTGAGRGAGSDWTEPLL